MNLFNLANAAKHNTETVIVNVYGDKVQADRLHPSWKDDYAEYLRQYAAEQEEKLAQSSG
jgi:pantothenate synthetase